MANSNWVESGCKYLVIEVLDFLSFERSLISGEGCRFEFMIYVCVFGYII